VSREIGRESSEKATGNANREVLRTFSEHPENQNVQNFFCTPEPRVCAHGTVCYERSVFGLVNRMTIVCFVILWQFVHFRAQSGRTPENRHPVWWPAN